MRVERTKEELLPLKVIFELLVLVIGSLHYTIQVFLECGSAKLDHGEDLRAAKRTLLFFD